MTTSLVERRDDAFLYRQLATLIDTVPLERRLAEIAPRLTPN